MLIDKRPCHTVYQIRRSTEVVTLLSVLVIHTHMLNKTSLKLREVVATLYMLVSKG